MLQNQIVFHRE